VYCPQCGTLNPDTAATCAQCGRTLSAAIPVTPSAVIPPGQQASVPNYLVFSILVTILCCLPPGIAAIVYAAQVNNKLAVGDIAGAQAASKNAKMWCLISVGAGLAIVLVYALIIAFSMMNRR
jgi:Interferon-induced transmembrane protein/zinc-ribbon domain